MLERDERAAIGMMLAVSSLQPNWQCRGMSLRSKPPEFALARQFYCGSFFRRGGSAGRGVAYARPLAADCSVAPGPWWALGFVTRPGFYAARCISVRLMRVGFCFCCFVTTCGAAPLKGVPGCGWFVQLFNSNSHYACASRGC